MIDSENGQHNNEISAARYIHTTHSVSSQFCVASAVTKLCLAWELFEKFAIAVWHFPFECILQEKRDLKIAIFFTKQVGLYRSH